jgi:hypothetical protein
MIVAFAYSLSRKFLIIHISVNLPPGAGISTMWSVLHTGVNIPVKIIL